MSPDGKSAGAPVLSSSEDASPPKAADGRGNTASVAGAKAAQSGGQAGPPASDPGCGVAPGDAGGLGFRLGIFGVVGALALRVRRRSAR